MHGELIDYRDLMTEYKLIEKTYKTERYVAPFMDKVDIVIMIWYHTTLKYWSVGVRFESTSLPNALCYGQRLYRNKKRSKTSCRIIYENRTSRVF